jgi:maleate isomerase
MAVGRSTTTLGVLIPSFNSAVEPELERLRPAGIRHLTARFALDEDVIDNVVRASVELASKGCQALVAGIATDSFPSGLDLLRLTMQRQADSTGLPVYAPSFATFEALRALDAKTVSIVTPFDDGANENVRAAAESQGFQVSAIVGLNRPAFDQIADTPMEAVCDAFARADSTEVDALVQVGTGLPMVELMAELERRFEKPLVASTPVAYWRTLRGMGRQDKIEGCGQLLERHQALPHQC